MLFQNPGLEAHNSFSVHIYNNKYNKVPWNEVKRFSHKQDNMT